MVIQSDAFQALASVTVLRITSDLNDWPLFRVTIVPSVRNGLKRTSQVMVDKAAALPREKIGQHIGKLETTIMRTVDEELKAFLGLNYA